MESAYSCVSHCTADNDLGARLFLTQQLDGLLHADNRRRHQRTQADHRNIFLDSGINDHLGRNVLAEVEHLIGVVFQQNLDDILADVVDISLDGRENDLALDLLAFALHRVLDDLESRLGRLCAHEQLRQEHGALLESLADAVKRRNQLVVDNLERRNRLQHFLCRVDRALAQAALDALAQAASPRRPPPQEPLAG